MLFLFGRFAQPVKVLIGVVLVVIGILAHYLLVGVAGGVLLLWGAVGLLGSARNRGQRAGRQRQDVR